MKLSNFKFTLPNHLIAQHPIHNKEEARLMVVHRESGQIEHKQFKDLPSYLHDGDALVVNDSKIMPCKLYGYKEKTNAQVEVLLLRKLNEETNLWDTIVEPARKIRIGNKIYFGEGELVAEIIDNTTSRGRTLKLIFDGDESQFHALLNQVGHMPLPSQINRPVTQEDVQDYQTVFAENLGGVVLPAAGRHFTTYLLKYLALHNVEVAPITLHIGLGELQTIDMEDLTKFRPCSEAFSITSSTADVVNQSLESGKKVIAVGTSVLRALEQSVSVSWQLKPKQGWQNQLILPSYTFKICGGLLTNFHLPSSRSLISVVAFGGEELILRAYAEAIKHEYQFFLYGDAMLIF